MDAAGVEDTARRVGDDNFGGPAGGAGGGSCPPESDVEGGGSSSQDEGEIRSDESAKGAPEGQMVTYAGLMFRIEQTLEGQEACCRLSQSRV